MTEDELIQKIDMISFNPAGLDKQWAQNIYAMREHIKSRDISNFLRWSTIKATMFTGYNSFTKCEYDEMSHSIDKDYWMQSIREPWIGNPEPFDDDINTSGNLVHQAYHLFTWEQYSGMRISQLDTIVEFGGGYGALTLIARRLGFRGGYIIFDSPEMLTLQEYYLSNTVDSDKTMFLRADKPSSYIAVKDTFENALVVGLWSLSESPLHIRESFFGMEGHPNSFLFAYQHHWYDINNHIYFQDIMHRYPGYQWNYSWAAESDLYLLGVRDR